jgi:putative peptide zinc metalloprotease protein
MQAREPQATTASAAPTALPPTLERTLIASGWTRDELRSVRRSPLANLQVSDLDASLVARAPALPAQTGGHVTPATAADDPNDTCMASDWSWMDALAAMSWADPQSTLVTPIRRPDRRPDRPAAKRSQPSAIPSDELEVTQVLPLTAALPVWATPRKASSELEAPAASSPAAPSPALPPALPPVPDRPAPMPGVQLLGTLRDMGFAEQQWLAQRGETYIQLSELLYRVLEQVDGRRSLEEIAERVRETSGRPVSANNVRLLIAARLLPLGLILPADGIPMAEQPRDRSPLAVTMRLGFLRAEWIEPVARLLQVFFWPPVLVPLALLIAAGQGWLYLVHGAATPLAAVLQRPLLLLGISTFILLSAVFHEFGHAAALRYGGGRARSIGFGVYFIYPAFYTDCTDSYRLGRWGRLRTDLGGVYFDLIVSLGLMLAYLATRQELLLAAVVLLDMEIVDQFSPIMRFDGYWALADLVGVVDFFVLIGPVLRSLQPTLRRVVPWVRQSGAPSVAPAGAPALKGWVKVAFLAYTVVAVPALFVLLGVLLVNAPNLLGFYLDSLAEQIVATIAAVHSGTRLVMVFDGAQAALLLLTAALLLYGLGNIVRSLARAVWRWGAKAGSTRRRALALLTLAGGLALLIAQWRPQLAVLVPHFAQVARQILHGP